ncbi:type VI secretion system-associated protein TagO [Burkholderia sp. Ac-20384]|uniref:type VI secretion system-associated protein VasI n=1 Tax=Burkholderia sp. Ac-20384 TaxID=2703902 RepID=UPI00197FF878|nr:type VI secretion system-associated protein VasI [Burkholderia sp. Ac-20384]MBN3824860.1 type VI secretion system-associated protein TagO [Burkholderia sp. Ac-20384]
MRWLNLTLLFSAALVGCDRGHTAPHPDRTCTTIVSPQERLACFDAQVSTPAAPVVAAPPIQTPARTAVARPDIVTLVETNEAKRRAGDTGSLLMRVPDGLPGQDKVVISVPALGGAAPGHYLAISCLQNISRLQLLTADALPINRANLRLLLDDKPVSDSRPWQVLEDGTVTDAGRGLVAVEQLRALIRPAQHLRIESDQAPFDGLAFDVGRLREQLAEQREACHW